MNKKLILASSLVMALSLVGCGQEKEVTTNNSNENTEQVQQVSVSMEDIQSNLLTEELLRAPFGESLDAKEFYIFEEVADKIEEGFVSQAMMNVKFQDIIVVKTSDVETIKTKMEDYLASDAVRSFKDGYGGEDNIEAVSNAIVNSNGDYAYLIATPNASELEAKLLELFN